MKKTAYSSRKIIPFCPYAKTKQYYFDKVVDWMLAAITSLGAVTALYFLMML